MDRNISTSLRKFLFVLIAAFAGLSLLMGCSQKSRQAEDDVINSQSAGEKTSMHAGEDTTDSIDDSPAQNPKDIEEFWTKERMRKAKPMPFPEAIIPEGGDESKPGESLPAAPPGVAPGRTEGGSGKTVPDN